MTVKDSFTFDDEILTQDRDLCMASLFVDALFINIPLDESVNIWIKKLFQTPETLVEVISKKWFSWFTKLATKYSFFTFNNKFCIQVDVVAIGFPLGPTLANIFLSNQWENWQNKCPIKIKLRFYRKYVDDIFVLFESTKSTHSFREYMSSKHQNITVT